jgi:hypothetical protein
VNLQESDVVSIAGTVTDSLTGISQTLTVSVAASIYDILQAWPEGEPDAEGYNFKYDLAASYLPVAGRFYQIVFAFTLADGTIVTISFELQVIPTRGMFDQGGTLEVTYQQLQTEIARYLGWTRDFTQWTTEEAATIEDLIRNGLRQFYWPGPLQDGSTIRWSFLSPQASLNLSASAYAYELPADFGGNARSFSFEADSDLAPPVEVSEQNLRTLRSSNPQSGKPSYYAVRPKASAGAATQRWEVLVYPTPATAYTLTYRYDIVPPMLTEAAPYPLGGAMHSKTILESCLAAAEEWSNDASGLHRGLFTQHMANSAKIDAGMAQEASKDTWPVTEDVSDTLDIRYQDIRRHVGQILDYGWDHSKWSRDQALLVDELVQSGMRQFYAPKPIPSTEGAPPEPPHVWSFLLRTDWIKTVASQYAYDLPDTFTGKIIGDMHYGAGEQRTHIEEISENRLRELLAGVPQSGPPEYVCLRVKVSDGQSRQRWEAIFYPTPSAEHNISLRYKVSPPRISEAKPYPLGGVDHAETILASCMAAAEERIKGGTQFRERYAALLAASIVADRRSQPSDQTWPVNDKGEATLDIAYSTLLKRVGNQFGFGWDVAAWSTEERRRVDMAIQDGLRQFYNPIPVAGDKCGHDWSFLRPMSSITCVASQYAYDLPEDFACLYGPITFQYNESVLYSPIEIVGEHQIRSRLSGDQSAARPSHAAIRPKRGDQSSPTRWELLLYPVPDDDYVLDYRYRINAAALDAGKPYPLGTQTHAQTILESCLAAVENTQGSAGLHTQKFRELLTASVAADKKSMAPDSLGYNGDGSDRASNSPFANWHTQSDNLTSYNGIYY